MKPKFNIGDRVRIKNYGHKIYNHKSSWRPRKCIVLSEKNGIQEVDISPELVGQEGIVYHVSEIKYKFIYALDGPGKSSGWNEDQLELVNSDDNNEQS